MRSFKRFSFILVIACSWIVVPAAWSDEVFTFVVKKQEEKAKTRWSLQDWLETRDKMRLMDLWLALHSPSPYEFFVGGGYRYAQAGDAPGYSGWNLCAAAYASIFGLELQREFVGGLS